MNFCILCIFTVSVNFGSCSLLAVREFESGLYDLTDWKILNKTSNLDTLVSCAAVCTTMKYCNAFVYNTTTQSCEMGRKYYLRSVGSLSKTTGLVYATKSAPLILNAGGWAGDHKADVELFDWKTGHICNGVSLPIPTTSQTGTFMSGLPILCGGEIPTARSLDCYKLQEDAWIRISPNLLTTKFASSVLVPGKGFYIFGGNSNYMSLQLPTIDGVWSLGLPYLFKNVTTEMMCTVQISDTVTGFFGGVANPQDIVLYFWTNRTYFKPSVSLIRPRYLGGCALVQKKGQAPVVAVAGGANSQGIEIYDPSKNTVKLIVNAMPPEVRSSSSYYSFNIVSVDQNTALIFIGGRTSGGYESGIMTYDYDANKFETIGKLSVPRKESLAMLVDDIECP